MPEISQTSPKFVHFVSLVKDYCADGRDTSIEVAVSKATLGQLLARLAKDKVAVDVEIAGRRAKQLQLSDDVAYVMSLPRDPQLTLTIYASKRAADAAQIVSSGKRQYSCETSEPILGRKGLNERFRRIRNAEVCPDNLCDFARGRHLRRQQGECNDLCVTAAVV